MTLYHGRSIRLMPNARQEAQLRRYAGAARFAWNELLAYCRSEYARRKAERNALYAAWANLGLLEGMDAGDAASLVDEESRVCNLMPSQAEQRAHLRELRNTTHPWLHEIPECVTKQAVKDLAKAYAAAFKREREGTVVSKRRDKKTGKLVNPYGFPEFHSKHKSDLSFYQRTDAYRAVDANHVKLTGVRGTVKTKYRHLPIKVANPRIRFDGRFWYFTWSEPCDVVDQGNDGRVVGVDVGVKSLAVTSDGVVYDIPENANPHIQRLRQRKKYLQRRLSRKYEHAKDENGKLRRDANGHVVKSRNVIKLEERIRRIDRDIANASRECRQQAVNDIVRSRPKTVVVEDLNVKGMFANRHLSGKLQRVGMGEFLSMLEWGCVSHGIELVGADRFYPSTQRCSCCGELTGPRGFDGLGVRKWTCPACGAEHDRDGNASCSLRDYPNSGFVRRSIKARGALRNMRVATAKVEAVNRVAKVMSSSGDEGYNPGTSSAY